MGEQLRWRTTPADVAEFAVFAQARGWTLVPWVCAALPPSPVEDWTAARHGLLVRPRDLPRLHWQQRTDGQWVPRTLDAPAVEFGVGHDAEGKPHARHGTACGRLWFATLHKFGDEWVKADPDFVREARALLSWPRRRWTRVLTDYESPAAFRYLEERDS